MTNLPQIEVADHALSVLGDALTAYTDPDENGHRARIAVVGGSVGQGFFDVAVLRSTAEGCAPSRFRVSVYVRPVIEVPERGERG